MRPAKEYATKEELDELRREVRADIADVRRLNERVSDKVDHIVIPVLYQIAGKVGATPVVTGGQ